MRTFRLGKMIIVLGRFGAKEGLYDLGECGFIFTQFGISMAINVLSAEGHQCYLRKNNVMFEIR